MSARQFPVSDCLAGMKSVEMSTTGVRCLLIVLLIATAAAQDSLLTTHVDCETNVNGSVNYHACVAGPEHVLAPGVTTFNVTIDPPTSTCGLTPQQSCTLVCIILQYQ